MKLQKQRASPIGWLIFMAEREGFEPPELSLSGFQDHRLRPLGHLSAYIVNIGISSADVKPRRDRRRLFKGVSCEFVTCCC